MSGAPIKQLNVFQVLKRHHRPLSARKILMILQKEGDFKDNYGELLVKLKKWVKSKASLEGEGLVEPRKGVFSLVRTQSPKPVHEPKERAKPSEFPSSVFMLHDGKQKRKIPIERSMLEEAERLSGYLQPYPSAPVGVADILEIEKKLTKDFDQSLWQSLQSEVEHLKSVLNIKLPKSNIAPESEKTEDVSMDGDEEVSIDGDEEVSIDGDEDVSMDGDEDVSMDGDEDVSMDGDEDVSMDGDEDVSMDGDDLVATSQTLAILVKEHLEEYPRWQNLSSLVETFQDHPLFSHLQGLSTQQRLKNYLQSVNAETVQKGQRAPFLFSMTGMVTLSAFGQSKKMLQLEKQLGQLQQEYQQAFKEHFLMQLSQLSIDDFESLMMTYLERSAYKGLEVLNRREDGRLALLAKHETQGATLVIAHRSEKELRQSQILQIERSLKSLMVEQALIIHLGGFEDFSGLGSQVMLINGIQLITCLIEKGIGVGHYSLTQSYVDQTWFESYKG